MPRLHILEWARKVQAIAQNGLMFSQDTFDRDRYQQLQEFASRKAQQRLKQHQASIAAVNASQSSVAYKGGRNT